MLTRRQRLVIAVALVACVVLALVSLTRDVEDKGTPVAAEPTSSPETSMPTSPTTDPATGTPGVVSGTVTGTDGSPLADVEVTVGSVPPESWSPEPGKPTMPPGPTWSSTTDERGRYRIEQVTPGPHRVMFSGTGRGPATRATLYNDGAQVLAEAPDLVVTDGGEARADAVLPQAGGLSGVVRNALGEAVAPGVPVVVVRRGPPSWVEVVSTVTRRGGRYAVGALPPGSYVVRVDHPARPRTYHPGATRPRGARTVVLAEGARLTGIDVELPARG